ncbi:MAG: TonB-dependent receptor domain-containing protein [Moraxellaceae bacterium]
MTFTPRTLPRRKPGYGPHMLPLKLLLPGLLLLGLAPALRADDLPLATEETELETVTVSALAMDEDANLQATPHSVMSATELLQNGGGTLGNSLSGLPGVQADTFGGGASRPVIRGQSAPRVSVKSDGASVMDASDISPDHAIGSDPLLASRVEVLRGPSTLRYGGGAIGGVVNVLDNRIATTLSEKTAEGFVALRGNTVAEEKAGAGSLNLRLPANLVLHAEYANRDAEDYAINGFSEATVNGSYSKNETASAGLSWIHERGYLGFAYTSQSSTYGLPGHSHEFEDCSVVGSSLSCNPGAHAHEHEEVPYIDLSHRRLDVRGAYEEPIRGIEEVTLRFQNTRYHHDEIEDGAVGTTFLNNGYETRLEARHVPLAGWEGVIGLQWSDAQFNARGEEGFIPKTDTASQAVFAVEHYAFNEAWHLELGARQEWQQSNPLEDEQNRPAFADSASSLSSALVWQFHSDYNLSLSLARAQRLPQAQELYANGVHLATNTYECGLLACPSLGAATAVNPETSRNIGLNLRKIKGNFTFDIGAYHNHIDDYIYARTLDQIEAFRLIRYSQVEAEFTGAEASADYRFAQGWKVGLMGDVVRAQRTDTGENLPRIPAARLGLNLEKSWNRFSANAEVVQVYEQDRIASYETTTPGHTMLNAGVNYRPTDKVLVFLTGSNLLGEAVWNHTSFLADRIPEPGRNLTAGLRVGF